MKKATRKRANAPTSAPRRARARVGGSARADVPAVVDESELLADLRSLIESARGRVASVANATTILLCWNVGRRLLRENLQGGRAAYGKQILATVSQELTVEFGAGFSYTALTRMVRFAEWITDERILAASCRRCRSCERCRIRRWDTLAKVPHVGFLPPHNSYSSVRHRNA